MITVGFTGTQVGMTLEQSFGVANFLHERGEFVGRHGDCVGADDKFDSIARQIPGFHHMEIHPMAFAGAKRAYCTIGPRDVLWPEVAPLLRNQDIVDNSDIILATPKEANMVLRSGTWTTIRYATKAGKPVFVVLTSGVVVPW